MWQYLCATQECLNRNFCNQKHILSKLTKKVFWTFIYGHLVGVPVHFGVCLLVQQTSSSARVGDCTCTCYQARDVSSAVTCRGMVPLWGLLGALWLQGALGGLLGSPLRVAQCRAKCVHTVSYLFTFILTFKQFGVTNLHSTSWLLKRQ